MRKVNRPVITIKMLEDQRETVRKLARISERPISWITAQAFNQLFRDLELGAVLPSDMESPVSNADGKVVFLQLNLVPMWMDRLKRLSERSGKSVSEIVRFSYKRYAIKRRPYLGDKLEYDDPFKEQGPQLPPR